MISPDTLAQYDELWLPSEIFGPNASVPITISTSYSTVVSHGLTKSEQRYAISGKPKRLISSSMLSGGKDTYQESIAQCMSLRAISQRSTVSRSLRPLFSDQTRTTSSVSMSATTIPCDTTLSRLHVGCLVCVIPFGVDRLADKSSYIYVGEIASVSSSQITVVTGPSQSLPAGSVLMPVLECNLAYSSRGAVISDAITTIEEELSERVGPYQLPGLVAMGTTPSGFSEHDGLPVFKPDYDYSEPMSWSFVRSGSSEDSGLAQIDEPLGSRGLARFEFGLKLTKQEAFEVQGFFDSRAGKCFAFWLIPPITEYKLASIESMTSVTLQTGGLEVDWGFRPYVYFELTDGSVLIREVSSVSYVSGDSFSVGLSDDLPDISVGDVVRCGVAYKSRFDIDESVQSWIGGAACLMSLAVIELEEEKSITIADIDELVVADLASGFSLGSCDGTAVPEAPDCLTVCAGPLGDGWDADLDIVIVSPYRLTLQMYLWAFDFGDNVFRYVGTDDPYSGCQGSKLAGVPYSFVYEFDEGTTSFVLNAKISDSPPSDCGFSISDVPASIALDCDEIKGSGNFWDLATTAVNSDPDAPFIGFFLGSDLSSTDMDAHNAFELGFTVRVQLLEDEVPTYVTVCSASVDKMEYGSCDPESFFFEVQDICDGETPDPCDRIRIIPPEGESTRSGMSVTGRCCDENSPGSWDCGNVSHNDTPCEPSFYDSGADLTYIWIGCVETTDGACDPASLTPISRVCCYEELDGNQLPGI